MNAPQTQPKVSQPIGVGQYPQDPLPPRDLDAHDHAHQMATRGSDAERQLLGVAATDQSSAARAAHKNARAHWNGAMLAKSRWLWEGRLPGPGRHVLDCPRSLVLYGCQLDPGTDPAVVLFGCHMERVEPVRPLTCWVLPSGEQFMGAARPLGMVHDGVWWHVWVEE